MSFVPVAQWKSSSRRCRFNVVSLKSITFVSQFTDHVVCLVRSKWNDDTDGLLDASNTMLGLSRRH